ncbi:MAG: hypothetical protein GEEBNDBF_00328 [bacterium]|nr:hypothetical protein [bacterium]
MFLLAFPVLVLAMLAAGLWLTERLRLTPSHPLEHGWIASVLGLLVLGLLSTALGFLQLLSPLWLWLGSGSLLVLGWRDLRWFLRRDLWQPVSTEWKALHWIWWVVSAITGLLCLLHGLLALAPNTQWDTMAHHFLVPEMYLRWGGIYDFQQVQQSYFPSHLQMLYALGMSIGGEQTASLLGWWWSVLVLIGVLVIGRTCWQLEAGIAGAIIMLTQELYSKQLQGGWADSGVALFVLLASWGLIRWMQSQDRAWLLTGALAMGGALASSKHNALLPMTLMLLGMGLWPLLRPRLLESAPPVSWKGVATAVALFIGVALLPPLCWYIRSLHYTGSPVYPLTLFGLFPGPELPVYAESSWIDLSYRRNLMALLSYPVMLTFSPSLLEGFQGRFPPQWTLLLPLLLWRSWRVPVVTWFTGLWVGTLLLMFVVAPKETRYMLFAVPWLALLSGGGVHHLLELLRPAPLRHLLLLLLLLAPISLRQGGLREDIIQRWRVVAKQESRAKYIARATPVTAFINWMNNNLPEDAFVFCLEDRTYRLAPDWTNYYAATEDFPQTAEESYTFCFRQGVTHLYLGDGTIIQAQVLKNIVDLPPDEQGITHFRMAQVMRNLKGELIPANRHWVAWSTVRRFLQRAGFTVSTDEFGIEVFSIPHDRLLSTPVQRAHYNVMGAMTEMYERGMMRLLRSDGLNMVFEYDYEPIALYEDPANFGIGRPDWTRRQ